MRSNSQTCIRLLVLVMNSRQWLMGASLVLIDGVFDLVLIASE